MIGLSVFASEACTLWLLLRWPGHRRLRSQPLLFGPSEIRAALTEVHPETESPGQFWGIREDASK